MIQAITLDMYGTLLDLEATFAPGIAAYLRERDCEADAVQLTQAWETAYLHESMVDTFLQAGTGGGRTPFEQIRRSTLAQLFARRGIPWSPGEIDRLLTEGATPTLFPDVPDCLERLGRRFTLAVLSNGDRASLERTVSGLAIPVERIISVEQAGCYKPDLRAYRYALGELGLPAGETLHLAAHAWDTRAARAAGMLGAYIDRYHIPYAPMQPDDAPEFQAASLAELPALLEAANGG